MVDPFRVREVALKQALKRLDVPIDVERVVAEATVSGVFLETTEGVRGWAAEVAARWAHAYHLERLGRAIEDLEAP